MDFMSLLRIKHGNRVESHKKQLDLLGFYEFVTNKAWETMRILIKGYDIVPESN